jgi:predicted transcriptional regulator
MSATTLEIRPALKIQLDHLAEESHRSESELANEAVALYLAQQRRISARLQEGLAQAQCGEFISDSEMEKFFMCYAEPKVYI